MSSAWTTVRSWYRPVPHRRPIFGDVAAPGNATGGAPPASAAYVSDVTPTTTHTRRDSADSTSDVVAAPTKAKTLPNDDTNPNAARYYCGGRVSKRQFVCGHLLLAFILGSIVLIPLMYFVVAPAIIRSKVASLPLSQLNITTMDVGSFDAQGLNFTFAGNVPAQFPISIWAKLTPRAIQIQTNPDKWDESSRLAELSVPAMDLNLKYPEINMAGRVNVPNPAPVRALLTEFSTKGLSARSIYARLKVDIGVFGITFYKDFEVEKPIEWPQLPNDLLAVWSSVPDWIKSPDERDRSDKVKAGKLAIDSDSFTVLPQFPPIKLNSVNVTNDDPKGPTVTAEIELNNPTVATVKLPPASFIFSIEEQQLATIRVQGVQLLKGKSKMSLTATIEIAADARDKLPRAIYRLVAKVFGGQFMAMEGVSDAINGNAAPLASLMGPFSVDKADFVAQITQPLVINLPIQQVLDAFGIQKLKDMVTPQGVQKLLKLAQFNATVSSTAIDMPFALNLPTALPLPTELLTIPFSFALTAAYTDRDLLRINADNLSLNMVRGQGLTASAHISVVPLNTDAAATGTRDLTNLVLVQGKPAVVSVKQMALMVGGKSLAWGDALLNGLVLNAPIPGLDVTALFDAFTNGGTTVPLALRNLLLHQLDARTGFHAESAFTVQFPDPNAPVPANAPFAVPRVSLDIGYARAGVSIDDAAVASVELAKGVTMRSGVVDGVAADAMLAPASASLTAKLQAIANALLAGQPLPSSIVIDGVLFGASAASAFKTFSLVRIPLALAEIEPIARKLVGTVLNQARTAAKPLVVVRGADVVAGATVSVRADMSITNLWPLDVSIGRTSLNVGIDGNTFAAVKVGAITIKPAGQNNDLSLSVDIQLQDNAAAAPAIKEVVEAAWQWAAFGAPFNSQRAVSVAGITLESPAANPAGKIDQFAGLAAGVSLATIVPLVPDVLKIVDASAILPASASALIDAAKPALAGADVATLPGAAMRVTPSVSLTNPLALSLALKWASIDVVLDRGYFCTAEVANVVLARGTSTVSPAVTLRCANTTPGAKAAIAAAVRDLMSSWKINNRIEVTKLMLADAADGKGAVGVLSTAVLAVPMQLVDLKAVGKPVIDSVLGSIPSLDSILAGTSSLNLKPQSLSVHTLPGATVQIGVAAELNNPLPFSASIGWLSLDAFIGGAALGHVTVAPFNLGRGRTTLSTTITIAGAQGDTGAAADNVAALVRTFLAGGELAYTVGVSAPRLGASDKDVITAFEQVRADIPLQAVLKGTHAAIDLAGLVSSRLTGAIDAIAGGATSVNIPLIAGMSVAVGQVSIAAKPGKQIAVATTLRINADFALDVQVGHFAAGALLNGVDMVSISADNLAIKQNADATLALAVQFADGENIQKQAADLVAHIFDNVIPGTMGVGRINLGASSTDTLSILSKISVDLPIDPIAKPVMAKVQAAVQSVMGGLGNSNLITVGDKSITITLTPTISIIVRDLSVATAPQKTLSITVVSDIKTPLPLSIDIPYVGAGVAINDQKLVSMGLRGVSLKNGSAAGLSLTADLTFDGPDAAANEIAHLVDVLMRGDSLKGTRFGVLAPAFGVSRDDSVQTFARVALAADAGFLDPVVANVRALVSKTIGALNPVLTSKGAQGWSLQLASALGVDVSAVDVKSQGSALLVNVDASLRLPIKLRANLGYVAAGLSYNGAALVSFETGIQLDDKLNKLSVLLRFSDADDAQTQVAALVASVLGRASPVPGTFGVSRAVVGASHDDAITAFQAVRVELAAQTVLAPVLALLPASLDIVDIATQFGVQLGAIDVKSLPDRRLAASVQVALTNPMPLSVQLGYASLAVGSDNVQFATASLSNLVLSANGKNQLTLATEIAFPDNAAAQAKLAALVADPAKATVFAGAIRFGGSPQESTALLAKTHIDAPVSMVNNDKFINFALKQVGLTRDDLKLDALIKRVALDSANVVVASTVVVDGSVTVTLPVALTVDMPVVALVAYANGSPLSGVNVRDLKISSAGGKLKVGFRAQLDMAAADAAQQTVADLINKFLAGDTQLSLSAGIGSLLFGATEAPKDVVTIARQVRYDLDVSGVIGYFRNMLPAKLDLVDLAERFGVQVSKVAVGAAPGAKITASAQVAVNLNLPINLSVDYTALTVGLGDASVVTVELGQLALHAGQKDSLSVTVKASFDNSDAAQNAVAAFVKQPSNIYFTGVRFGASVDNNIRLLAKARLVAPASLVSNDKVFDYVLKQVGLTRADLTIPALIKRLDITSLDVALAKKTTVHAVASLALPVDIKVNMPYAGASAYLDGVLLASAGVFDLAVTSRDGRVFVDTRVEVDMSETDATQTKVADLVDQLISGKNITLSAGADSVAFGASPTDAVRTLTKVHLDLDVTPVLGQIKDFASGYIKTVFDWLKVEALTTGVVDQHTLAVSVAADISKLPLVGKISLSLKYASLDVALNNMHVLSPRVTSLTLAGGKVKAAVLVDFDLSGPSAAEFGEVLNQIGDLVFYKPIRKRAFSATVSGIKFGASPSSPVMIAGKVKATVDAIPYLNQAADWYTKSSVGLVKDIQATLTPAGIDVDVLIKLALPIELPVSLEFGSLSARIYYRGFGDAIMVNNWVTNIQFSPSGELRFHLLIDPVWDTVMNGLNDAVPLLVSWKDVAQNAFLGGFRMHNAVDPRTATPAQTFLGIDSARMSPPPLILYSPLSLRPILVNPFKEGLGINLDVGFTNPGPIHINIGKVYFGIVDGNKAIGGISLDNAVLRNHAESNGGKNDFLVKARLTLHLLDIPGLLIDLLAHREKFGYKCDIRWDDKELVWINRIVERLPPALLTHIVSILVGLIRNSSIHLFAAEGQKLAAANPALVADAAANNGTAVAVAPTGLSRRWLTKRADETITKIELSKWTADPVISPDFSQFVKVDWSALAVATE